MAQPQEIAHVFNKYFINVATTDIELLLDTLKIWK